MDGLVLEQNMQEMASLRADWHGFGCICGFFLLFGISMVTKHVAVELLPSRFMH
jgi:hypothetical protein